MGSGNDNDSQNDSDDGQSRGLPVRTPFLLNCNCNCTLPWLWTNRRGGSKGCRSCCWCLHLMCVVSEINSKTAFGHHHLLFANLDINSQRVPTRATTDDGHVLKPFKLLVGRGLGGLAGLVGLVGAWSEPEPDWQGRICKLGQTFASL